MANKGTVNRINGFGASVFLVSLLVLMGIFIFWSLHVMTRTNQDGLDKKNISGIQQIQEETDCSLENGCKQNQEFGPTKSEVVIPVLIYHHIRIIQSRYSAGERAYSISPVSFEKQMKELQAAGYTPIRLDDFWMALNYGAQNLPDHPVLLTFDDGYKSHYTSAYPILKKYHFPATFFIYTKGIKLHGYMSEEMLHQLASDVNMTIGAHSVTHRALTHLSKMSRREELEKSKRTLERVTEQSVTAFSYPYGAFAGNMDEEVEKAGYKIAFRIGPSEKQSYGSRFRIQRIQVLAGDSPVQLIKKYAKQ